MLETYIGHHKMMFSDILYKSYPHQVRLAGVY